MLRCYPIAAVMVLISLASPTAWATPPARDHFEARSRIPALTQRLLAVERVLYDVNPPIDFVIGELDVIHADQELHLDPSSGQLSATIDVELGNRTFALSTFGILLDQGITVVAATSADRTVSISQSQYAPYNYVQLFVDPPPSAGHAILVTISYQGILSCPNIDPYEPGCKLANGGLSFFDIGAALPQYVDLVVPYAFDDRMTSLLELHTPTNLTVTSVGNRVEYQDDGTTLSTVWAIDQPLPNFLGRYIITGDLSTIGVPGLSLPALVYHPTLTPDWAAEMAAWTPSILAFMTEQTGQSLPYEQLSLIMLPPDAGFPGTASHAMTLLIQTYADLGDESFEEIWAHENIHHWWGVAVSPDDVVNTRLLTEGLTTLSQIDYTYGKYYAGTDRDQYLAMRYRDNDLMLRYLYEGTLVPPVRRDGQQQPQGMDHTIWAYYQTSAVLDYLRITIGEQNFAIGLRQWAEQYSYKPCDTADFGNLLESISGISLAEFFDQWVYDYTNPEVTIGFSQNGNTVTLELKQNGAYIIPLELWLEGENGLLDIVQLTLTQTEQQFAFSSDQTVRAVRANPRQDPIIWSRSAVDGDLNFDGEVDGTDVIQCAKLYGKKVALHSSTGPSICGLDLAFDPRCDRNGDGAITDDDLAAITQFFPHGRTP